MLLYFRSEFKASILVLANSFSKSRTSPKHLNHKGSSIVYAKFFEKLTLLTPWYAHVRVRIWDLEMLAFWKILRTYFVDDP